jgi:hypothetical protein
MFEPPVPAHSRRLEFPIHLRFIGTGALLVALLGATGCAHATTAVTAGASPTRVPRRITGPRTMNVPSARPPTVRPLARRTPGPSRPAHAGAHAPPAVAAVPQILGATVSPSVVRSGTVVHATVRTTAGVVAVVAHAGGAAIGVPRIAPGLFSGSTTIPPLPSFVHGSYPVTFVARDARGASTQSAVGVTVR